MRKQNKKLLKYKNGFTLIELLVSVAVLTVGIGAALSLISQNLKSASYFRNQTTAAYLAVEGIELVKNKRDGNLLSGANWLSGFNNCINENGCYIDAATSVIDKCNGPGPEKCPNLKYDSSINFYNYSNGRETIFIRKIRIENVPQNLDEEKIISEIKWSDRFGSHNYQLNDHIFNWPEQ